MSLLKNYDGYIINLINFVAKNPGLEFVQSEMEEIKLLF
jgi:hypothetical protein